MLAQAMLGHVSQRQAMLGYPMLGQVLQGPAMLGQHLLCQASLGQPMLGQAQALWWPNWWPTDSPPALEKACHWLGQPQPAEAHVKFTNQKGTVYVHRRSTRMFH